MQYLEERARELGIDIDAVVASIEPSGGVSVEGFLELIEHCRPDQKVRQRDRRTSTNSSTIRPIALFVRS
jgi:hypothetical protein